MDRIRALNRYQKTILILLAVMLVGFTVLYAVTYSRLGIDYGGHILVPQEKNGTTVYSGRIRGEDAVITVTGGQTVTIQCGDRVYGPYTAREDPTAVPEDSELASYMTGVEIREGDKIFFRGGVYEFGGGLMTMDEDGSFGGFTITYSHGDGIERDMNGNPVDQMKPTATAILELLRGPELTRKGEWMAWLMGSVLSALTAVSILFADELFRWNLSFRVRDPEYAEPTDWEIAQRYISWTVLPVFALVVYVMGLL